MQVFDKRIPTTLATETWRAHLKERKALEAQLSEALEEQERKRIAFMAAQTKLSNAGGRVLSLEDSIDRLSQVITVIESQYNFDGYVTGVEDE